MLIICHIDWREVGVAVELQCLRNCTLSSFTCFHVQNRDKKVLAANKVFLQNFFRQWLHVKKVLQLLRNFFRTWLHCDMQKLEKFFSLRRTL